MGVFLLVLINRGHFFAFLINLPEKQINPQARQSIAPEKTGKASRVNTELSSSSGGPISTVSSGPRKKRSSCHKKERASVSLSRDGGAVIRSALPLFLPLPYGKRPLMARQYGPTE